jgi:hypothetical protein
MCYLRGCLTYFHLNCYYYYLHNVIIIYITNDLRNSIKHSRHLFADDIKIYRPLNSAADGTLLQSEVDSVRGWCAANCTIHNIDKTRVIAFTRLTNLITSNYNHKLCDKYTTRTESIKDLGFVLFQTLFSPSFHYKRFQSL